MIYRICMLVFAGALLTNCTSLSAGGHQVVKAATVQPKPALGKLSREELAGPGHFRCRSSITGRYVTVSHARANYSTTQCTRLR